MIVVVVKIVYDERIIKEDILAALVIPRRQVLALVVQATIVNNRHIYIKDDICIYIMGIINIKHNQYHAVPDLHTWRYDLNSASTASGSASISVNRAV